MSAAGEREFAGKVVLVSGASAGIGAAVAEGFAAGGAALALGGRDAAALAAVAGRCRRLGAPDVLEVPADLATDAGCDETVKRTLDHFQRLDVLVNNAGCGARTDLARAGLGALERVLALNVRAPYNLTRQLRAALVAAGGCVVNVSSVSGAMPNVGSLPYSMSKAALDQFSRCIALELAPLGVRVNTVSPGYTVSKFVQRLTDYTDEQYQAWLQEVSRGIPLGAVCEGADVAAAVLFLASPRARLVTGQTLAVDGGLTLRGAGDSAAMRQQIRDEDATS